MELQCDIGSIQNEELLRKMWQQSEDIERKKEIRSHLYKLRESRLRNLYQNDTMSDNTVAGFGKDPLTTSHGDSLVDQSFQSLKSKEVRDSMSPVQDLKFHSTSLNHPNTTGWDVQTSSEVSPDGRAYRTETVAKTDGVEKLNGGVAEFQGRNEQRSAASHQGDDKNFVKKASESSNTQLQEKVVFGDENSGHTEMKMSSTTSSTSSHVVQSSSSVQYDDGEPQSNRYLMDADRNRPHQQQQQPQQYRQQQPKSQTIPEEQYRQQLNQQQQQQQRQQEQYEQHLQRSQQQQQETRQQQFTEEINQSRQESNTTSNVETQQRYEENKRYVDMDKASPEYQRHVQYLMAQPGEVISNTVEYPKPNVKMITTVKRLPDGTIVKNKRYETEEMRPTNEEMHVRSTTTSTAKNVSKNQRQIEEERNLESNATYPRGGSPTRGQPRTHAHPQQQTSDVVDNVDTIAHRADEVTTQSFSSVKKSSRRFSTETTSETVEEFGDSTPSYEQKKPITGGKVPQDFSTHGFPSVKSHKPTQEYPSDRPHNAQTPSQTTPDFSTQGFPSVRPTQGYPNDAEYVTDVRRGPGGEEIIVVKSEKSRNIKQKTSSERVIETEIVGDDYQPQLRQPYEEVPVHGYPATRGASPTKDAAPRHGTPTWEQPSGTRRTPPTDDFSTNGFPSVRSKPATVDATSETRRTASTQHTNTERIIETTVAGDYEPKPRQPENFSTHGFPSARAIPKQSSPTKEYPVSPRRSQPSEDFSTHGFPSVRSPTKTKPDHAVRSPTSKSPQRKPQTQAAGITSKKTTTTTTQSNDSTRKLLQKEREVDSAHRAFAASLRSSSPVDSISTTTSHRRDSNYSDHQRQTPRSSVSSARTFRRDTREGSHDSNTPSEMSRISTTTVTRSSPSKVVGKTVVTKLQQQQQQQQHKTRNVNGSNETIDIIPQRSTKSPSSSNNAKTTVTTVTTTTKTVPTSNKSTPTATSSPTPASPQDVPKTDNHLLQLTKPDAILSYNTIINEPPPLTKNNNNNNNKSNNNNNNTDIIKKIHVTANDAATFAAKAPIEEPICVKKNYYKLGPSDKPASNENPSTKMQATSNSSSLPISNESVPNASTATTTTTQNIIKPMLPHESITSTNATRTTTTTIKETQNSNDACSVKNVATQPSVSNNSQECPKLHVKPSYSPDPTRIHKNSITQPKDQYHDVDNDDIEYTICNDNVNDINDNDDDDDDIFERSHSPTAPTKQTNRPAANKITKEPSVERRNVLRESTFEKTVEDREIDRRPIDNAPNETQDKRYTTEQIIIDEETQTQLPNDRAPKQPKSRSQTPQRPLATEAKPASRKSPERPISRQNKPSSIPLESDEATKTKELFEFDSRNTETSKTTIKNFNDEFINNERNHVTQAKLNDDDEDDGPDGSLISKNDEPEEQTNQPTFRKKGLSRRETFEDRCRKILGMEEDGDTQGNFSKRPDLESNPDDRETLEPVQHTSKKTFEVKIEDCVDDDDDTPFYKKPIITVNKESTDSENVNKTTTVEKEIHSTKTTKQANVVNEPKGPDGDDLPTTNQPKLVGRRPGSFIKETTTVTSTTRGKTPESPSPIRKSPSPQRKPTSPQRDSPSPQRKSTSPQRFIEETTTVTSTTKGKQVESSMPTRKSPSPQRKSSSPQRSTEETSTVTTTTRGKKVDSPLPTRKSPSPQSKSTSPQRFIEETTIVMSTTKGKKPESPSLQRKSTSPQRKSQSPHRRSPQTVLKSPIDEEVTVETQYISEKVINCDGKSTVQKPKRVFSPTNKKPTSLEQSKSPVSRKVTPLEKAPIEPREPQFGTRPTSKPTIDDVELKDRRRSSKSSVLSTTKTSATTLPRQTNPTKVNPKTTVTVKTPQKSKVNVPKTPVGEIHSNEPQTHTTVKQLRKTSDTSTSTSIKDRLRSATRTTKPKLHDVDGRSSSSLETSPTRINERRRSSNISVHTEIIIDHNEPKSPKSNQEPNSIRPSVPSNASSPLRKLPVTERKESAPVPRVTRREKDVKMARSTSENVFKVANGKSQPSRVPEMSTLNPNSANKPNERGRPNKCLTTKTINLRNTEKVIKSDEMDNVIIDIQQAKSSREPSPDKIVPTPVPAELDTGKPRYPDVVQEPEDEPRRKPVVTNIPIFEEESNDYVGCQIYEVSLGQTRNTEGIEFLDNPTIEAPKSLDYTPNGEVHDDYVLSVHEKVSKFTNSAEEVKKPKASAPFSRQIDSDIKVPEDDECLLSINQKVEKFLKTADTITKQPVTPIREIERPNVEDIDEELRQDDCTLSVSQKVNKFMDTAEKLAPTVPQKSPRLVASIERHISRQSEPELEPEDQTECQRSEPEGPESGTDHEEDEPRSYTSRTSIEHTTAERTSNRRTGKTTETVESLSEGRTTDTENELVPMSRTHTEQIELKRQKQILSRPSVFTQKPASKKPISVPSKPNGTLTKPKSSPAPTETPRDSPKPENHKISKTYQSTTVSATRNRFESPKPVNSTPKRRPSKEPINESPSRPKPKTTTEHPSKRQPQSSLIDNYQETDSKHKKTSSSTKTSVYTNRIESRQKTDIDESDLESPENEHVPHSPTFRETSPSRRTTQKSTVVKNTQHSTKFTSSNSLNSSDTEQAESLLENTKPVAKPSTTSFAPAPVSVSRTHIATESVAARRNIFESQGTTSPTPSTGASQKPAQDNRRPSYMDHTKSSLEHIRRDSLEINKNNYTRKSSVEEDNVYERNPNSSVKFDVPKRKKEPTANISEDVNIEEIFDLEILEELLETVTSYELRRRIRAQIRLVKKNLINASTTAETKISSVTVSSEQHKATSSKYSTQTQQHEIDTTSVKKPLFKDAPSPKFSRRPTNKSPEAEPTHKPQSKQPRDRSHSPDAKTISSSLKEVRRAVTPKSNTQYTRTEHVDYRTLRKESSDLSSTDSGLRGKPPRKPRDRSLSPVQTVVHDNAKSTRPLSDIRNRSRSPQQRESTSSKGTSKVTKVQRTEQYIDKRTTKSPERRQSPIQPKSKARSPERSHSPQGKASTVQRRQETTINKTRSQTHSPDRPKAPIWADRRNVLKSNAVTSGTNAKRAPDSSLTTNARSAVSKATRTTTTSCSSSVKQRQTKSSEEDSITSSYGIGPTDENGLPLFGIRALKKKTSQPAGSEPSETTEVTGYVIEKTFYSDNKSKPVVGHKETIFSTNADELEQLQKKVECRKSSTDDGVTIVREFKKIDKKQAGIDDDLPLSALTSAEDFGVNGAKYVRRGSVKEMSDKFIRKESQSSETKTSSSSGYPKAGLILRTNSRLSGRGSLDHENEDETEDSESNEVCSVIDATQTVQQESESECESVKIRQKSSSAKYATSTRSFLNTTEAVTSVDDVLERMRNADNVVEEGDTAEDREARALLNKFLGASVIMQGVESIMPQQQSKTKTTTRYANSDSDNLSEHAVKTTRITKTIKTGCSSSPVTHTTCDIEEIWDEETLKQLLEQASNYEERRKIRARLRELMAEREETKTKAGAKAATATPAEEEICSSSSVSEYEEIIEEVTDYSDDNDDDDNNDDKVDNDDAQPQQQVEENDKENSKEQKKEEAASVKQQKTTKTVTTTTTTTKTTATATTSGKEITSAESAKAEAKQSEKRETNERETDAVAVAEDKADGDDKGESLMPLLQDLLHQNLPHKAAIKQTAAANRQSSDSKTTTSTVDVAANVLNSNNKKTATTKSNNNNNRDKNDKCRDSSMVIVSQSNNNNNNTHTQTHASYSNKSKQQQQQQQQQQQTNRDSNKMTAATAMTETTATSNVDYTSGSGTSSRRVKSNAPNLNMKGQQQQQQQVNRLSVPQKEDSGTESGEDLRLLAAGLRDKLQMHSDTNLIEEVTAALSRLESSLKEGKEIPVDGNKRKALLALVARLQTGLTSPEKLAEFTSLTANSNDLEESGIGGSGELSKYEDASSPETADVHRTSRQRFAKRRQRNSRHTVGVSREELADARRYMEDMLMMESISNCTTPDSSVAPVTPPQWFPIEKNASAGVIPSHPQSHYESQPLEQSPVSHAYPQQQQQQTAQLQNSTLHRPNQFVPNALKNSTDGMNSTGSTHTSNQQQQRSSHSNRRPLSGDYSVSFANVQNSADAAGAREAERAIDNTSPDNEQKSTRFTSKRQLLKRANTIDIPKTKKYNPDFDSDSEADDKNNPSLGLKRTVQVSTKRKVHNVVPPFEPKTENDHKFLAFINKQSTKSGLGWTGSRSVSNWTNKFGNIKHTFEVGSAATVTTGKPPLAPGHVPQNAAKNYWNKQAQDNNFTQQHLQQHQHQQQQQQQLQHQQQVQAQRKLLQQQQLQQQQLQQRQLEAAEHQKRLEMEMRRAREHQMLREKNEIIEREHQERQRLELERQEREFYERERQERERQKLQRLAATQHTVTAPSVDSPAPGPTPFNKFIHAPQSVFRPIENSVQPVPNIYKPIPQLPQRLSTGQQPLTSDNVRKPPNLPTSPHQYLDAKQPLNATQPSPTATSPIGLPWVSKPKIGNSDFRRKANHFEERSLRDNLEQNQYPYLQRHNSLRAAKALATENEDFKKRPSLPNTTDPYLAMHAQYAPQPSSYLPQYPPAAPPPTNISFSYADLTAVPRSTNYRSYPCLPTAVDYAANELIQKDEDSLTNPQAQPLVLTSNNPSYCPPPMPRSNTLQPYSGNALLRQLDYISPVDSTPTSPSFMTMPQTDNTDDDLDSDNMMEYRAETKVMRKPKMQTAVTVAGRRAAYVSDDEVFGKNSRAAKNLLHTMKNMGSSMDRPLTRNVSAASSRKSYVPPTSPKLCLSPDGRQYQAPHVEPLFPNLTSYEPNRLPLYASQDSLAQKPASVPVTSVQYQPSQTYPAHSPLAPQELADYNRTVIPDISYQKINRSKNVDNVRPYVSDTPASYVVTYPLDDSTDDQDSLYQSSQKQPPKSLPLQRPRHLSENSTGSSSHSYNLPSPNTSWTANPMHTNHDESTLSQQSNKYYQHVEDTSEVLKQQYVQQSAKCDTQSSKSYQSSMPKPEVGTKPNLPQTQVKTPSSTVSPHPKAPTTRPKLTTRSQTITSSSTDQTFEQYKQSAQAPMLRQSTADSGTPLTPLQPSHRGLSQQSLVSTHQVSKVTQQQQQELTELRRKSLGNVHEQHSQSLSLHQQEIKQEYKSSAPPDTPDIVKSSLPKDENAPILKKFGPPQRHLYVPNAYQNPIVGTQSKTNTHNSSKVKQTSGSTTIATTTTTKQRQVVQHTTLTNKPSIVETPATPQLPEDLIPRNIVFNNVSAFTSMSQQRRKADTEVYTEQQQLQQQQQQTRPNRLSKCDSWNQIVTAQHQSAAATSPKYSTPAAHHELRRTKSGHTLALPKMYEAGIDKANIGEKQKTVAAYFASQKSSSVQNDDDRVVTRKTTINRTKTADKVSTSRKSLSSLTTATSNGNVSTAGHGGAFFGGGLSRSATMPHIANMNFLDESNVEDAFEQLIMAQQQQSSTTTERSETKAKNGAVVTTTTKVTTRTVTGTAPKPVSPFSKFQQLDKQNSQQSAKSPSTPTTPGGSAPLFKFTDPALCARAATVKDQLLQWCQSKTQEYENVQITNFSSSWSDGLAFCALIHHFLPDAFDYSKLTQQTRRKNFELAFTVADEKAGIAPLLDVEDMVVMKRPDWKCVFVYVQSIYRRFRNCQ